MFEKKLFYTSLEKTLTGFKVSNKYFTVEVDLSGRIVSMVHHTTGNEVFAKGQCGNQLLLFDDIPLYWDAWDCMDYHLETRSLVNQQSSEKQELHVTVDSRMKVTLTWSQSLGKNSQIKQNIHVTATDAYVEFETFVGWKENRKFLKVEFPVLVHTHQVTLKTCRLSYKRLKCYVL